MSEFRVGSLAHANAEKSYTPKVGDKVRAVLGKSVIVGEVADVEMLSGCPLRVDVYPTDRSFDRVTLVVGGAFSWHFEQVVSVPSKFGAVIRRADGVVFVLAEPEAADNLVWFGFLHGWATPADATAGGFSVLFDGVDE